MGGLDGKLRARWDALIGTEGKAIGLSECRPFLENKMVNDIFYEGKFKGRDCIVKCSSKAPDSVLNEFALARRVFAADPSVTPEPLACRVTDDGRMAFIVTAKASGPSLTELAASGISETAADSFVSDILRLADALKKAGVVHRDLFSDNLLMDSDGHLKAIDFQFAVDKGSPSVPKWLQRNWKYHFVVFARVSGQPAAYWNDASALRRILGRVFRDTPCFASTDARLAEVERDMGYHADVSPYLLPRIAIYRFSAYLQCLFCRNGKRKELLKKRSRIAHELSKEILFGKS